MNTHIRIAFIIFLCTFVGGLEAAMASGDIHSIRQAAKGNSYTARNATPLAQDIVTWYRLRQQDKVTFTDVERFVAKNPHWPDMDTIRKKAEGAMHKDIARARILKWFQSYTPLTGAGKIYYLNALISSGQTAKAMAELKNWWEKAAISAPDQKEILSRFGQYLGSQDHERRLRYIVPEGHYTAGRALAMHMGSAWPRLVEAQIALLENKPNVTSLINRVPAALRNNEALVLARLQWRRKNKENIGAIRLLETAPASNRLSRHKDWWKERHIIARRLMEQNKWGSAYKLVSDHRQKDGFPLAQAEFLAGWLALRKIGKPWEAFEHFERLFNNVKSPISRARGAYWAGLASETLDHPEIAMQWYQVAAKYQTTFYGQMAAQHINLPLGLINATPIAVSEQARNVFKGNALIRAGNLIKKTKRHKDAKRFFHAYINEARSGLDFKLIAEHASQIGYQDVAVRAAKKAERDGFIMPTYLFPVLRAATSKRYAVAPSMILGISRQESAFDITAKSPAGALGLMQLMPATANETARKINLRYSRARLTTDPTLNITLGSAYLRQMLDRFDGNLSLAAAAYNAGPGRVSQWLKEFGDPRSPQINEVDWIETIPVYETRNYVQRVTEAVNVYNKILP